MDNPFDAMSAALRQARELNQVVDRQANTLADLLDGRLRHVSGYRLKQLKAQLRDFNASLWLDGDLIVYGAVELEDGGMLIDKAQLAQIRRLVSWSAPA